MGHDTGNIYQDTYLQFATYCLLQQDNLFDVTTDIDIRKIKDTAQENISSDMMTLDGGKVNLFLRDEKS